MGDESGPFETDTVLSRLPVDRWAQHMVETQIAGRDVYDPRVRAAMERLPRHRFVPSTSNVEAYADNPMPIGHGQTISQPYMVAVMTQELGLRGPERTLEIGTGSGYQTAVLAALCAEVYTVERIGPLQHRARLVLEDLGFTNISYRLGDGSLGWPEHGPYDRVLVTAAAPDMPENLKAEVADNGILVAPVGEPDGYQQLVILRRHGTTFETTRGLGCRFVPLVIGGDPSPEA